MVTVEELEIPRELDDSIAARDFLACAEVRNAVDTLGFGSADFAYPAEEELPGWLDQVYTRRRSFAARVGGRIVAHAYHQTQPDGEGVDTAWQNVRVLPEFRGRGMGTALATHLEDLARSEDKRRILCWAASPPAPGPRLDSPTGHGSLPADNPEVRFLLSRGFRLEQVERGSRLALPVDDDLLTARRRAAEAHAGTDYRVHHWVDRTPERWRADRAMLMTRMSTDAPSAGMEEPADVWTVQRLLDAEERWANDPRHQLMAVVEHVPTSTLVGYSLLIVPPSLSRPVDQDDTLVLREHRGHRLGMLLKVASIRELQRVFPGHPSIITFNAEENRFMLDVNDAVGFAPIAFEGAWRKDLT